MAGIKRRWMPKVLHVGCGRKRLKHIPEFFQDGGWEEIRLDIDPAVKPDIVGTMTDLSGVATGAVDAVFSSHNIEHLYAHEVPVALAEFRRVLSDDGFALVTCPDLQSLGQALSEGRLDVPLYQSKLGPISLLDILYGHRKPIAEGNHYMAHRGGFSAKTLSDALRAAGFPSVATLRRPSRYVLWAYACITPLETEALRVRAAPLLPKQQPAKPAAA
jgi:hypothetical protein